MTYDPAADPEFAHPYVDIDEWREADALGVRHRYVHGGFTGTQTRFSFYLPPAEDYQGRFFQHVTPVPESENLAQQSTELDAANKVAMAFDAGAAFVETNGGGGGMAQSPDPSLAAYRANAASAEQFRAVASAMYGEHRAYGYLYGGSGGGFRTIGSAENTAGVWDGFVPYVIGSPMAMPNVFCVRQRAHRVLAAKLDALVDAFEPGGVDPYSLLNDEEADALREVTAMGFPPRSWFDHATMGLHGFRALFAGVKMADPTYFTDFWTVPGYEGADPGSSVHRDRVRHATTVAGFVGPREAVELGLLPESVVKQMAGNVDNSFAGGGDAPVAIRLASAPPAGVQGADLVVTSGDAAGAEFVLEGVHGEYAILGFADGAKLSVLAPGDEVRVDNSDILAAQTYHRHQVPGPEYAVWDQYRNPDGTPRYPQRPFLVGPLFTRGAAGSVPSGDFDGKMIVVACLMDKEAYPWQADWYAQQVAAHGGAERFRLWYVDRALHGDRPSEFPTQVVSYLGVLHQALRDVAAWAEGGAEPAASSSYEVVDGQVVAAPTAAERGGVQPVLTLTVDGSERADVAPGAAVEVEFTAEAPAGGGGIVDVQWDLDGDGVFEARDTPQGARVELTRTATFDARGTYFVTVVVAGQRDGDPGNPYTRLENLARARVIVA